MLYYQHVRYFSNPSVSGLWVEIAVCKLVFLLASFLIDGEVGDEWSMSARNCSFLVFNTLKSGAIVEGRTVFSS